MIKPEEVTKTVEKTAADIVGRVGSGIIGFAGGVAATLGFQKLAAKMKADKEKPEEKEAILKVEK